jgi:glucose-1-phosphate adenylyltransferase
MIEERVIAFVMAGGEGSRLQPLTAHRSKPSVPFDARYRIIDFVLSSLINSRIRSIYLLVQYKSQSLIEHVRQAWALSPLQQSQFVTVVPPQMRMGEHWFQGTADAVYQNLSLIEVHNPTHVAVFGADHIYRMDIRQMLEFHRQREADVTVSALPVPLEEASSFGVIGADTRGRILEFQEKPAHPTPMPNHPDKAFASMGNYLFNTDVLLTAMREARGRGETDFGRHVLPRLMETHNLFAYDFSTNRIPGIKPYEEPVYWRDVGNIDAYFETHKDVLGIEPKFDMFNPQWPVYSSDYQGPVARVIGGDIRNSLLGAASLIHDNTRIRNSIIRREVVIEEGAELEDCIVMDYCRIGRGAKLRRVILDRHNIIEPGCRIGFDPDQDRQRFQVSPGGVVVVPLGKVTYYARGSRGSGGPGYAE